MVARQSHWFYGDDTSGKWVGPLSLNELIAMRESGSIDDYTRVINSDMLRRAGPGGSQGVPFANISLMDVDFSPTVDEIFASREQCPVTVFSGPNNGGKSLLLKQLCYRMGHHGYLVGCNRFSHVDALNTRQRDANDHRRYFDNFSNNFYTTRQNTEDNELKLEQVITGLRDGPRAKLFSAAKELLGNTFALKKLEADNEMSPFYVDMDGENLRFGSSGTRLLLTLLGILLDDHFSVILIDEPEIGLSPRIQGVLARFLYNSEQRTQFCPHLKQVFLATHSHFFLDRTVFSNNYTVSKAGRKISVTQVNSVGELHQLQFNFLGNDLESIFLPSAIAIVEGDSDVTFLTKTVKLHLPNRKVAIVRAGGDGEIQNKINVLKEAFGDLATSPYRDRLFIVLDSKHSLDARRLENQGVRRENITVWSQNGIEYYYPPSLIAEAFCCDTAQLADRTLERDPIELNDIRRTKKELATFVADRLTTDHPMVPELEGLIHRIRTSCT